MREQPKALSIIWLSSIVLISLVILISLHLYLTAEGEMVRQFNQKQLILVKQGKSLSPEPSSPHKNGDYRNGRLFFTSRDGAAPTDEAKPLMGKNFRETLLLILVVILAVLLGISLSRRQAKKGIIREEVSQHEKELEALNKISDDMNHSLSVDEILRRITSPVSGIACSDYSSIFLVKEDGRLDKCVESSEASCPDGHPQAFAQQVLHKRVPLAIEDTRSDEQYQELTRRGIRSAAGIPIDAGGAIHGVLLVYSSNPRAFTERMQLLAAFADRAAAALNNAKLFEQVTYRERLAEETLNSLPDCLAILSKDGRITKANYAMGEKFGVPTTYLEGKRIDSVFRLEGRNLFPHFPNSGQEAEPFDYMGEAQAPSIQRTFFLRVGPIFNPGGQCTNYLLFGRDITDRITGEQNLLLHYKRLAAMASIISTATRPLELDYILQDTLQKTVEVHQANSGYIFLYREEEGELELITSLGVTDQFVARAKRRKLGQGISGRVALTGQPIFGTDFSKDPRVSIPPEMREDMKGFACVPLRAKGKVMGALTLAFNAEKNFSEEDIRFLTTIGDQVGLAVDNARLYQEARRKSREANFLSRASVIMNSSQELSQVLEMAAGVAVEMLGDSCTIFATDDRKEYLLPMVTHHADLEVARGRMEFLKEHPVSLKATHMGRAINRRRPFFLKDTHASGKEVDNPYVKRFGIRSNITVPLVTKDNLWGALSTSFDEGDGVFTNSDLKLALALAERTATAMENARLYEELTERATKLSVANQISKAVSSTLDLEVLYQVIFEQMHRVIPFQRGYISTYQEEDDTFVVNLVYDENGSSGQSQEHQWPAQRTMMKKAHETGQAQYIMDMTQSSLPLHRKRVEEGFRSAVAVPIVSEGQVLGVLVLLSTRTNGFTAEQLGLLDDISSHLAIALRNAELYSRMEKSLKELQETQDNLIRVEKLTALGEMAGGVAHDFNNILAVVMGNTQLLIDDVKEGENQEKLKVIERAARDGAETVRRLHDFTRRGKAEFDSQVKMNEVAKEVREITRHRWKNEAEARGIKIDFELQLGDVGAIRGNPAEIREVLTNVVFNALDAMPTGGTIKIATFMENDQAAVAVSDTGVGMDTETQRKVFDPFFTTKGIRGSGLGMSIAYGIIRRHGGDITLSSKPGEGTTFYIKFPVSQLADGPHGDYPETAHQAGGMNILVIDDEEEVCAILSNFLIRKGHKVDTARSGIEGIKLFERGEYHLVFTDLGMPDINGWEVVQRVRDSGREVYLVLVTGWGMQLEESMAKQKGADAVICKPFELNRVSLLLQNLFQGRRRAEH